MADKKTCHVTLAAHGCVRDPRSVRAPVFPSPPVFDAKTSSLIVVANDHGKGTRRFPFFFDPFLSASSSSLDALKRDRKSFDRDKNAIKASFQRRATPSRVHFEKKEEEEKNEEEEESEAHKQTHRLETSLFGAVTRTDWAAAVWVKENIIVGVCVCVCT